MVNDNTDGDGGKSGASLQETKGGFVKKVSLYQRLGGQQ